MYQSWPIGQGMRKKTKKEQEEKQASGEKRRKHKQAEKRRATGRKGEERKGREKHSTGEGQGRHVKWGRESGSAAMAEPSPSAQPPALAATQELQAGCRPHGGHPSVALRAIKATMHGRIHVLEILTLSLRVRSEQRVLQLLFAHGGGSLLGGRERLLPSFCCWCWGLYRNCCCSFRLRFRLAR